MSQTISRMYSSPDQAIKAANELKTNRFDRFTSVHVVTRGAGADTSDSVMAAILKAYVLKAHARVYAEGVMRGGTLVTVHAPFGTAVAAIQILNEYDPNDSGVPDLKDPLPVWDEATPISCALHWPVLLDDSDTFARFWNIPALSRKPTTLSSSLNIPELSRSTGAFTGTFGMSLLSNKPTILSSMLGLPLLMKRRAA